MLAIAMSAITYKCCTAIQETRIPSDTCAGKLWPIMLKILPIMLLIMSSAQKVTHYAQYYAHNYCNYATVHM